jgi:hypothetical protein
MRGRGRWLGGLALAIAMHVASPAMAGPEGDGPNDPEARSKLGSGMEKFDAGDYEAAQRDFQASYDKEPNPLSLWGLAQATNKVDGCHKSVKLYRQFSKMVDDGSPAYDVALQAIAECADKLAREGDDPPPAPEPTEGEGEDEDDDAPIDDVPPMRDREPAERPWHRDPLGGVLVGVGAAGLATGVGLLVGAAVEHNNPSDTYDTFERQQERADRMTIAGAVVAGVGGALLVGGVIRWAVLGVRQRGRASAGPLLHPRGVGLSITGRF